jgi:hypothetical protein
VLTAGVLAAVPVAWFTGYLVVFVVTRRKLGDFTAHLDFTVAWLSEGRPVPGNGLLYWLTAGLAGYSPPRLLAGLVVVLAAAAAGKAVLTVAFVAGGGHRAPVWALVGAALCPLALSLPMGDPYLGQIAPNVWHNSTTTGSPRAAAGGARRSCWRCSWPTWSPGCSTWTST